MEIKPQNLQDVSELVTACIPIVKQYLKSNTYDSTMNVSLEKIKTYCDLETIASNLIQVESLLEENFLDC